MYGGGWRYVDDIFVVIRSRFLNKTLEWLNGHFETIQFTYEVEENGILPFLDLKIIRKDDYTIKFGIYRKLTNKSRFIMSDSFHHNSHKAAAFYSMIHRAINVPMQETELTEEREKINQLASLNGYDQTFVDKIFQRHLKKTLITQNTTLEPLHNIKKRISVPFYPAVTNKLRTNF